jgi:ParB/RepB/Spo0J family partition protein
VAKTRRKSRLDEKPTYLLLVGLAGSPATRPSTLKPERAAQVLRESFRELIDSGIEPELAVEQLAHDHGVNAPSQNWIRLQLADDVATALANVDHRHQGESIAGVTRYGKDDGLALLGAARKSWELKPTRCSDIFDVPVELIDADPSQPRKTFDPDALRELGESMRIRQIHPIMVRPDPKTKGRFVVVAGERRWRAANLVRLATIRAEVCDLTPEEVAQVQLAENENRVQPPESETADFVATQIDRGLEVQQIARAMGRTRRWVEDRACMARLAPNLKKQLDARKLPVSVAAALCELPVEIQTTVWESAREKSKTASGQEAYVRAVTLKQSGQDLFGQPIIEFIAGLSPVKRRKLRSALTTEFRAMNRLANRKPEEILAATDFPTATIGQLRQGARRLQQLAKAAEKALMQTEAATAPAPATHRTAAA